MVDLERTLEQIEQGIAEGLHRGAQTYVSVAGEVVADWAVGDDMQGRAMSPDRIVLWLSSGKPVTAVAVMQQVERGRLDLDAPVASVLPEFQGEGKETITARHLLTHTAGLRQVTYQEPEDDWDTILARIYESPVEADWPPGERAGYHVGSSWYLLAEMVRRVDGRDFRDYVRSEIFVPLDMDDSWIGMSDAQAAVYGNRLVPMQQLEKGEWRLHHWSTPRGIVRCAPGGNARGPIRELGYFYEALLAGGTRNGTRVLSEASVRAMTSRERQGLFDETFRHKIDWGLGLIVQSNEYGVETLPYGYGRHASRESFGHSGSQSSVAFADPERQLVVAIALNGMPGEGRHQRRIRPIVEAVYQDLGFAVS